MPRIRLSACLFGKNSTPTSTWDVEPISQPRPEIFTMKLSILALVCAVISVPLPETEAPVAEVATTHTGLTSSQKVVAGLGLTAVLYHLSLGSRRNRTNVPIS
jgi:hypothetical protein